MADLTDEFTLLKGCIGDTDNQYFLTFNDDAAIQEVPNGQLFILKQKSVWSYYDFAWTGVAVVAQRSPELRSFVIGRNGEVLVGSKSGFSSESVEYDGKHARTRGPIQGAVWIGNHLYAYGMGRLAYKRSAENHWVTLENGFPDQEEGKVVGINSMDGYSEDELYAVGWGGEIWLFEKGEWTQIESPTNVMLRCVVCTESEEHYICGANGLIMAGSKNCWNLIEYEGPQSDWITMCYFNGNLYLGDSYGLYILKDGEVEEIMDADDGSMPITSMDSSQGLMLAAGSDCAYLSTDGAKWQTLPT